MNFQTVLEIYGGGPGSGCNPMVAKPKCGRPVGKGKQKPKAPIKFRVHYKRGKKVYFISRVENMNIWLHHARTWEERKKLKGQDRPPFQVKKPPRIWITTDPEKALLMSRVAAEEVDKILWKNGKKDIVIDPVKTGQKKQVEEEQTRSRSKLSKKEQQELKDKGALVPMSQKGIKYTGTVATPRRIVDQKQIKIKVEGSKKLHTAIVTIVKPTSIGTQGTGTRSYRGPHSLSGKFSVQSDPIKIKAENRTSWIYNAESGKGPGWGTTVMVHQVKHTPTKSTILVHQLEREQWAEQISQVEFKFKKGKVAQSFLFERYGIRHRWRS